MEDFERIMISVKRYKTLCATEDDIVGSKVFVDFFAMRVY